LEPQQEPDHYNDKHPVCLVLYSGVLVASGCNQSFRQLMPFQTQSLHLAINCFQQVSVFQVVIITTFSGAIDLNCTAGEIVILLWFGV